MVIEEQINTQNDYNTITLVHACGGLFHMHFQITQCIEENASHKFRYQICRCVGDMTSLEFFPYLLIYQKILRVPYYNQGIHAFNIA